MSGNIFSEERIKQLVREEVRRIFDTGLMYTETTNPSQKPEIPKPVAQTQKYLQFPPNAREYIDEVKETPDGKFYHVKMKYIGDKTKFKEVAQDMEHIGGEFVSAGKDSFWEIPK